MAKDKELVNEGWLIIIPVVTLLMVNQYLSYFNYFDWFKSNEFIDNTNERINQYIRIIRFAFLIFVALAAYVNANMGNTQKGTWAYFLLAIVFSILFLVGQIPELYMYNLIAYPIVFLAAATFTFLSMNYVSRMGKEDDKSLMTKTKKGEFAFQFNTDQGTIYLTKPEYGTYFEAGAGGGKSVLIKEMLWQACSNGYAGTLYDFEGDCTEPGGAELTRTVLTSLNRYNKGPKPYGQVGFAYLNFSDPTRTVRVNPLNPKYIKDTLELAEFGTTLMTNLEPEWLKKKDFWAGNAISYCNGILLRLYNDKSLHKYLTIPHLVAICTKNYEAVFRWILQDSSLERNIMPLFVAYQEQAKSQIAGAVSSAALPITQLLQPEIFWPLSPQSEEETFDLDITNELHPVFFCIGTVPKKKFVLGPICSLILLICMNNMNQFGKRRSLFTIDELPTIFIPNLDNLPATGRKKGISTILSVQSFKQLEYAYGKEKAMITRDNLSNQFIGKTRNIDTAKHIVEFFGKHEVTKESLSSSDSGDSVSFQKQKEARLEPDHVLNQPIGHWTGILADGKPPYFHTQFGYSEQKLLDIPTFSKRWETGENELDLRLATKDIKENYLRILREIDDLLQPFEDAINAEKNQA